MDNQIHDIGIAIQMGSFSDAFTVQSPQKWLFTSGMPGLSIEKALPKEIEEQSIIAWDNILKILSSAGMKVGDIVKMTQYLTDLSDVPVYSKIRKHYLGDHRPASTLLIVSALGWPEMRVEVEIIAAQGRE